MNRIAKQQRATALLRYEYNLQGQLVKQQYEFRHHEQQEAEAFRQTLHYDYNELGQFTHQQVDDHDPIEFGYDDIGRLHYQKLGKEQVHEFSYNQNHQLTRQRLYNAQGLVDNIDYHYDQSGNLVKRDDHQLGVEHFSYDIRGGESFINKMLSKKNDLK